VAALRARGVAVVPTVTEAAGLRAFAGLFADPARRGALVSELTALAASGLYAGLDLDFEQFTVDRSMTAGRSGCDLHRGTGAVGRRRRARPHHLGAHVADMQRIYGTVPGPMTDDEPVHGSRPTPDHAGSTRSVSP
jgi:hypothetical protein